MRDDARDASLAVAYVALAGARGADAREIATHFDARATVDETTREGDARDGASDARRRETLGGASDVRAAVRAAADRAWGVTMVMDETTAATARRGGERDDERDDALERAVADAVRQSAENGSMSSGVRFVADAATRARALGIGDEATWEHGLSDNARGALEIIGRCGARGITTIELNKACGGKSMDHAVRTLAGAGLVSLKKTNARSGATENVARLRRFARSETSRVDESAAYNEAFTRILDAAPQRTALAKSVRERLHEEFAHSSLLVGKTMKQQTKVFNAVKLQLCRLKYVEPVLGDIGDSLRLLRLYDANDVDENDVDGEENFDDADWTGRGARAAVVAEQTFETQLCQRVRECGSVSQAEILSDYDVAPRVLEKRVLKMCDDDKLFRRVTVQRGKAKVTFFAPNENDVDVGTRDAPATTAKSAALKEDLMIVDDATRRYDILVEELRMKGFLYINRLSTWLAAAEGGLYKAVDKKSINAIVDNVVRNGEGVVREIAWSVTERPPDKILFHIDYPFDPASAEDAAFIEALKDDIQTTEVAHRQRTIKKLGLSEVVRVEPMQALPAPPASTIATRDVVMEDDVDIRSNYRTLHDFHAIGLGYIKSALVRLEALHLYLVANVFERGSEDGAINGDVLDGSMPISIYIKVVNSTESKSIVAQDLEHIKAEGLREKLVKDLPRELRDKVQSTYYMSRLTQRLMTLGLLYEVPQYNEATESIELVLTLRKSARFQTKPADTEDESSWSENFDVTTETGAREYWSALENTFKGKPEMDNAHPAIDFTYPRITSVRAWNRKWALSLDNCIILMDRLREAWDALLHLLLVRAEVSTKDEHLNDGSASENKSLVGAAIESLAESGLPNEDALRVEQLAQDLDLPDDLNHIKQTWRNFCYAKICAAVTDGVVSSDVAARALNMYAHYSRFKVSSRVSQRSIMPPANTARAPTLRLDSLSHIESPSSALAKENIDDSRVAPQELFDDDESDGEFGVTTSRKKFIFGPSEDEFLVFCMIRFIALSGTNALRAEKRDYRASVVYSDPMWRSRYPVVKKRTVVKRWRQLTVGEGEDEGDIKTQRHDAILRIGAEFYERGARARRDSALPHLPSPTPDSSEAIDRWDEIWDCTGKWSEGIAKQVLQATRAVLHDFPVPYPLPRRDVPKSPRHGNRMRQKREEKVRRIRAGRDLTEADDDIILARLAPIAFLRRRAISFQDESDDSDEDDVSDYDDSDVDEEITVPFKDLHDHVVPSPRVDALSYAQTLFDANAPNTVACIAPNGPQVLTLCQALVDNRVAMSTTTDSVGDSLPQAFNGQGAGDSTYFKSPNVAVKAMHSVKIEILDASKASAEVAVETVGTLRLPAKNLKNVESKCLKIVEKAGTAVPSQVIIDELRVAKVAETFGALGAYNVHHALGVLVSSGALRTETHENEIVYSMPSENAMDFADNAAFENCTRAAAAVALNQPGSSETRIVNALGKSYPIHLIARALNHLVDEGVLLERVTEKFFSVVPPVLGGSTMGDEENMAERHFFIADETSPKTTELLIGDSDFLV